MPFRVGSASPGEILRYAQNDAWENEFLYLKAKAVSNRP